MVHGGLRLVLVKVQELALHAGEGENFKFKPKVFIISVISNACRLHQWKNSSKQ